MSSAHSFITEAQIDLVFTFILFPICLGSTLESIPVGCRPTLHWASQWNPEQNPVGAKKTLCSAYFREISACISAFFFFNAQQAYLDFLGLSPPPLDMCNNKDEPQKV